MMKVTRVLLKEPALHWGQWDLTGYGLLIIRPIVGLEMWGQSGDCRMAEQISYFYSTSSAFQTADYLDRTDRVATQLEVIFMNADTLPAKHQFPDLRQKSLRLTSWLHICGAGFDI